MTRTIAALALLLFALPALAQYVRPKAATIFPTGARRGVTVTFTLSGVNIGYGNRALVDDPAIDFVSAKPDPVPPADAKNPDGRLLVTLRIGENARLGTHFLRIVTPRGASEPAPFVVGAWPDATEIEPDDLPKTAQKIAGPVSLSARSDRGEDIDFYRIALKAGETFVAHADVESIASPMEPVLDLLDASGHEVASGRRRGKFDALLTFTAPDAGEFVLRVHDLRYAGGAQFAYRLTLGPIPLAETTFPLGGALPISEPDPTPTRAETEPNDSSRDAPFVTAPIVINGNFLSTTAKNDRDIVRFRAKKGDVFEIDVRASRLGSPADPVLVITDAAGATLAQNDDTFGRDPFLAFTAPADGEFFVALTERSGKMGESYAYRLKISSARPEISLAFFPESLALAPGDSVAFTITAQRKYGANGPIALRISGLPGGVRALGEPTIPAGKSQTTLILRADDTAKIGETLSLAVEGVSENLPPRRAQPLQEDYTKRDDKIVRVTKPSVLPALVIAEPSEIVLIALDAPETLILKPGATVEWIVKARRRTGFTAKVPLVFEDLPAGVTVEGAELGENQTEVKVRFKVDPGAPNSETSLLASARVAVDELRFFDHAIALILKVAK